MKKEKIFKWLKEPKIKEQCQEFIFDQTVISIWKGQDIATPFYFCSKLLFRWTKYAID